jgi:flagellar biosynthesis component FlhA
VKDHNIYTKALDENGQEVIQKLEIQQLPASFKHLQDYEQTYEEFWKDIVEKDGKVDMEQVKKELADYRMLLKEVPAVYDELAGFSKPHTRAQVIIDAVNERMIDKQMAFDDLTARSENGEVTLTVAELKEYFDIREDY